MKYKLLVGALTALVVAGGANAAIVTADLEDVTNGGGFFAKVTIEDVAGGVKVTGDIADPINAGLTQGDILGIGMSITDETLLSGMTTANGDPTGIVTGTCFTANSCDLFTGGSGSPGTGFDIVVDLGVQGADAGFIQTLSFELLNTGLTAANFIDQLIGMRVQSIEGVENYSAGSSKLVGSGPGTDVPEPGTLALLGAGLIGMGLVRRRRAA